MQIKKKKSPHEEKEIKYGIPEFLNPGIEGRSEKQSAEKKAGY